MINTSAAFEHRASLWAQQGVDHTLRCDSWSGFCDHSKTSLAWVWHQPDVKTCMPALAISVSSPSRLFSSDAWSSVSSCCWTQTLTKNKNRWRRQWQQWVHSSMAEVMTTTPQCPCGQCHGEGDNNDDVSMHITLPWQWWQCMMMKPATGETQTTMTNNARWWGQELVRQMMATTTTMALPSTCINTHTNCYLSSIVSCDSIILSQHICICGSRDLYLCTWISSSFVALPLVSPLHLRRSFMAVHAQMPTMHPVLLWVPQPIRCSNYVV